MSTILKVENVSKQYRLGVVGTGSLRHDFKRWWYKLRGKEDPFLKVGAVNDRSAVASSDYVWALQDINFEVAKGEVLGIIGKNGAGKSTLLKILSKVTGPTTGVVKSNGRIASLLEVGTGFHPELTGRENIFLNGAILGMTKAEIHSKIDEIVSFSGCEMYIDTPVKRYSSGMRVRLAFAVAAHLEPDILVIDEVLAVGDAEFQKKAVGKMQDISHSDGRTVLFVSHNMAAVKSLCTRAIVLEHGKTVFEGGTDEAVDFYLRSNGESEIAPLSERTDRIGSGILRLTNVAVLNENLMPVAEIISGNPLCLKIEVEQIKDIDFSRLSMAINFRDNYEHNVLSFVTDEMDVDFGPLKNQGYFYFKIPKLLLRGENYHLRIAIFDGKTIGENLVDKVENIVVIRVLPGDFWNTGMINRQGYSGIMNAACSFNES